jgi:hypothetical protein
VLVVISGDRAEFDLPDLRRREMHFSLHLGVLPVERADPEPHPRPLLARIVRERSGWSRWAAMEILIVFSFFFSSDGRSPIVVPVGDSAADLLEAVMRRPRAGNLRRAIGFAVPDGQSSDITLRQHRH